MDINFNLYYSFRRTNEMMIEAKNPAIDEFGENPPATCRSYQYSNVESQERKSDAQELTYLAEAIDYATLQRIMEPECCLGITLIRSSIY
jgi:hypothetical protein